MRRKLKRLIQQQLPPPSPEKTLQDADTSLQPSEYELRYIPSGYTLSSPSGVQTSLPGETSNGIEVFIFEFACTDMHVCSSKSLSRPGLFLSLISLANHYMYTSFTVTANA